VVPEEFQQEFLEQVVVLAVGTEKQRVEMASVVHARLAWRRAIVCSRERTRIDLHQCRSLALPARSMHARSLAGKCHRSPAGGTRGGAVHAGAGAVAALRATNPFTPAAASSIASRAPCTCTTFVKAVLRRAWRYSTPLPAAPRFPKPGSPSGSGCVTSRSFPSTLRPPSRH